MSIRQAIYISIFGHSVRRRSGKLSRSLTLSFLAIAFVSLQPVTALSSRIVRSNGKIAFTSMRDGNREIYVINSDGTDPVRLTTNPGLDDYPAWSPDGRRLAYMSVDPSGRHVIMLMDADGKNQTPLTTVSFTGEFDPSWAPSLMGEWSIAWSPDGSKLAFSEDLGVNGGQEIFVINVDGSGRANLTNDTGFDIHPTWSPDSSKIIFSSNRIYGGYLFHLFSMNADGSSQSTFSGVMPGFPGYIDPAWSPDGAKLASIQDWGPIDYGIFTVSTFGGARSFYNSFCPCDDFGPAWSPDGTKVVYSTAINLYPHVELFVYDLWADGPRQLTNTGGFEAHPSWQPVITVAKNPEAFDFDGDGRTDISVLRPAGGEWWIRRSSDLSVQATFFGSPADVPAPADYTGDGRTDIAVYRPSDGAWYALRSEDGSFYGLLFGMSGDIPAPADYDGDGKADAAVFRPSNGAWYILGSTDGFAGAFFGTEGDRPAAADYDGDSKTDIAVFRPSNGAWYIYGSTIGFSSATFGYGTDLALPDDYDGDGKADVAVYRPSDGTWYILGSQRGFYALAFGAATDIPAPGDYDGDGKTDAAVFRPSNGAWYILGSTSGFSGTIFGLSTDEPLPSSYIR